MIPCVAYFYWAGKPLPWLRAQSMATFARHHPGWRVVLGSPDLDRAPDGAELERDTITDPALPPAARSDVWRYWALQRGGVYADTDVLFLGPLDQLLTGDHDAWITRDGGTPIPGSRDPWIRGPGGKTPAGVSIGLLAAKGGSQFFARAFRLASVEPMSDDYQSHGTRLLVRHWASLTAGLSLGQISFAAVYGGSDRASVGALWRPGAAPAGRVALHWYGGSPESVAHGRAESAADLPDSPIRRALS